MDDLYDDLENYNDFAELEVLRKENKELKTKLQEYDLRIDKLQKDFDKVSSEFKNLEINYSSLLKTAKAEIERKTQTISFLNSEKDKLVLNSIQSSNKNIANRRRNFSRGRLDSIKKIGDDTDSVKSSKKGLQQDPRNRSLDRNRNEEKCYPSVETPSSANSDDAKKNLAETKAVLKNADGPMKPMSIKNRRKSMPVVSHPKFTSDEEGDENSADEYNRKWPQRKDRRKSKPQNEGLGFDDKFSNNYREPPRDNYYPGRYNKSKRHRGKFGPSERQKRHFSPDRNIEDNEYQRHENRRSRGRSSPPLNKYDSQCKNRNRSRSNYERDNYDGSTQQHRPHTENYPFKHKIHGEYGEPATKRARIDTSSSYKEDKDVRGREKSRRALEALEEPAYSKNLQYLQHESCQSPDYSNPEILSPQPVREIKINAATNLEDPRLASNKYVRKSEDDKVVLSTSTGRNVSLQRISLSKYNHDQTLRKQMPKALQEMPSNTEEMIKDIYMDVDNPLSNMSLESGEFFSETASATTPDLFDEKDELDSRSEQLQQNHTLTNKLNVGNTNNSQKNNPSTSIEEYRIPKVKKPEKAISCTVDKNPLALLLHEINDIPEVKAKPVTKCISMPLKNSSKLDKDTVYSKRQSDKKKKEIKSNQENKSQTRQSPPSREIVAEDLELSDENSDNVDLPNTNVVEKTESLKCADKVEEKTKTITKELNINNENKEEIDSKKSMPEIYQTDVNSEIAEEDTNNKKKSKKKSHKQKSTTAKDSKDELNEKKSKPKEEIKAKFSDLFGDSSSLITPEDLGLVAVPEPESGLPTSYNIQIFEDAQDAIDQPKPSKIAVELDKKQNTKIKKCKSSKSKKNTASDGTINVQNFAIDNVEPKPSKIAIEPDEKQNKKINEYKSKPKRNIASDEITYTQNFAIDVNVEPEPNKIAVETDEKRNTKMKECKFSKPKKNITSDETIYTQNLANDVNEEPEHNKIAVETGEKLNTKTKECKSSKPKKNITSEETTNTQNFAIDANIKPKPSKITVETDEKPNTKIKEYNSSKPKKNIASEETTNTQNFAIEANIEPKHSKITVETDEKQNTKIKECKSSKLEKNIASDVTADSQNSFINLNASDDKDNNVVNTVIISTGVQPQIMPDPVAPETTKEHNKLDVLKDQSVPIALATSTPHKNLLINDISEVNCQSLNNSCNRTDIKEVQDDMSSRTSFSSVLDSQSVPDAPDVRIFVKRRKKLIKKT